MSYATNQGFAARYAGKCTLCGRAIAVGQRIFVLPASRRGAEATWVCWQCRWPTARTEGPTVDTVIDKIRHRLSKPGKPPSLNRAEAEVLIAELRRVSDGDGSEEAAELLGYTDLMVERIAKKHPPNLDRYRAAAALRYLDARSEGSGRGT